MPTSVEDALLTCGLIPAGERVLAAVSGGADSMAMLDALHTHTGHLGIELLVGSFDHRLRPDSTRDLQLVSGWCDAHGVPFFGGAGDVAAYAGSSGASIEAAARELRYAFLEETAQRRGAGRITTAHTRDDQIETVLMRLEHGAGVRGLAGIQRERGAIVRPLLEAARVDTRRHCTERGIPFVDDPGNTDLRFARNRIRHEVLPAMYARNPATGEKLLRIGAAAARTVTRIRQRTAPLLDSVVTCEDGTWVVAVPEIERLDARARYVFFGDLLTEHIVIGDRPGREHYRALAKLCEPDTPTGCMVTFPGGCARREYEAVALFPDVRHPDAHVPPEPGAAALAGAMTRFDGYALRIRTVEGNSITSNDLRMAGKSTGPGEAAVAYFDADSLELPLVVRHPRSGDRIQPFGMPGHRALGDMLSDHKVPPRHRRRSLVVEDQHRIIWLVGITTCESTRVQPRTRRVTRIDIAGETAPASITRK